MLRKSFLYSLSLGLALIGFVESRKYDINKFNTTLLRHPHITSAFQSTPFWDPNFCDDWQDMDGNHIEI